MYFRKKLLPELKHYTDCIKDLFILFYYENHTRVNKNKHTVKID